MKDQSLTIKHCFHSVEKIQMAQETKAHGIQTLHKCRMDFEISQTRNLQFNIKVIGRGRSTTTGSHALRRYLC